MNKEIKFIDLFAGIGGIRRGFEQACKELNLISKCVFTSEIKPSAITILNQNYPNEIIHGDITKIKSSEIPDFDYLLAGFPCPAFSSAGKRLGFEDPRGKLFFEVARIIKDKKPKGFLLENVEGLITHNKKNKKDEYGETFKTILETLEKLNYKISWKLLNSQNFGVPQARKRVYIIGTKTQAPSLDNFEKNTKYIEDILEKNKPLSTHAFVKKLLSFYSVKDLYGKSIKDKRGGENNIHSWDIELKGPISANEKELMNLILTERRKKHWAQTYGIDWMDGMPLTQEMIKTFYTKKDLNENLKNLVEKGYLVMEHPKKKVNNQRIQDETLPLGYNIVAGKMSFEVAQILDPKGFAPTLVALDMQHIYVPDGKGIRRLTLREGLRLFGYPDDFKFNITEKEAFDLLGNTVVVPVIKQVALRLLNIKNEE